jgi:hypothetical protein
MYIACSWGLSSVAPLDRAVRVFLGKNVGCSSFSEPENHRQWRILSVMAKGEKGHHNLLTKIRKSW